MCIYIYTHYIIYTINIPMGLRHFKTSNQPHNISHFWGIVVATWIHGDDHDFPAWRNIDIDVSMFKYHRYCRYNNYYIILYYIISYYIILYYIILYYITQRYRMIQIVIDSPTGPRCGQSSCQIVPKRAERSEPQGLFLVGTIGNSSKKHGDFMGFTY